MSLSCTIGGKFNILAALSVWWKDNWYGGIRVPFGEFVVLLLKEFKNRLKTKLQDNYIRIKAQQNKTKQQQQQPLKGGKL